MLSSLMGRIPGRIMGMPQQISGMSGRTLGVSDPVSRRLGLLRSPQRLFQRLLWLKLRLLKLLLLFCLAFASTAPAWAQGNFTNNGPYSFTLTPANSFTATIYVTYNPTAAGPDSTGYLTLSGGTLDPDYSYDDYYYTNVHMSFSPTLGGTPTITDTFDCIINAYPPEPGVYCISSNGLSNAGN